MFLFVWRKAIFPASSVQLSASGDLVIGPDIYLWLVGIAGCHRGVYRHVRPPATLATLWCDSSGPLVGWVGTTWDEASSVQSPRGTLTLSKTLNLKENTPNSQTDRKSPNMRETPNLRETSKLVLVLEPDSVRWLMSRLVLGPVLQSPLCEVTYVKAGTGASLTKTTLWGDLCQGWYWDQSYKDHSVRWHMSRLVLGPVLQRPLCEVTYVKAGTGTSLTKTTLWGDLCQGWYWGQSYKDHSVRWLMSRLVLGPVLQRPLCEVTYVKAGTGTSLTKTTLWGDLCQGWYWDQSYKDHSVRWLMSRLVLGPVLQRPLCEVTYVKAGTGASLTKSTLWGDLCQGWYWDQSYKDHSVRWFMSRLVLGPVLQRPLCEVTYVKAGTGTSLTKTTLWGDLCQGWYWGQSYKDHSVRWLMSRLVLGPVLQRPLCEVTYVKAGTGTSLTKTTLWGDLCQGWYWDQSYKDHSVRWLMSRLVLGPVLQRPLCEVTYVKAGTGTSLTKTTLWGDLCQGWYWDQSYKDHSVRWLMSRLVLGPVLQSPLCEVTYVKAGTGTSLTKTTLWGDLCQGWYWDQSYKDHSVRWLMSRLVLGPVLQRPLCEVTYVKAGTGTSLTKTTANNTRALVTR